MEEYNKVLKEIDELNVKYEKEYLRYANPYYNENFNEDDEVKENCEIILEIFYTVHLFQNGFTNHRYIQ